jgi:hypothetical protein
MSPSLKIFCDLKFRIFKLMESLLRKLVFLTLRELSVRTLKMEALILIFEF